MQQRSNFLQSGIESANYTQKPHEIRPRTNMLVRRISIENVRSFLDRREMKFDGSMSIIIGPNGGGKTNLLDTLVTILKRYLFSTRYPVIIDHGNSIWMLQENNQFSSMNLDKHSQGAFADQIVEIDVEVTKNDIDNMKAIRDGATELRTAVNKRFNQDPWVETAKWRPEDLRPGKYFTYTWRNGTISHSYDDKSKQFFQYLQIFEFDNSMRSETGKAELQLPMLYLPVQRTSSALSSSVRLPDFNDYDQRRATDVTTSRNASSIIQLAVGRMATNFRLLQETTNVDARKSFRNNNNLINLTNTLSLLGYSWDLETANALTNEYTIRLTKQGSSFLVGSASSGEREILTYLFAIYALNVRDALIIVDEPELHLHPRWQATLFTIFEDLARSTGNQFVLATHSPTFVSPSSIQFVSRVYSKDQKSNIVRLNSTTLPNAKHLFNVVNSHNNERIFFTDKVILVEGLSDRIVFEKLLDEKFSNTGGIGKPNLEVIGVGGKGFFPAYAALLEACQVDYAVVADLDYIEQVGSENLKKLFKLNEKEIKDDVIDNIKSFDGNKLVSQIETAMDSGSWEDARATWEYIKSRRRTLKPNLNEAETVELNSFIEGKRKEQIYILRRGALETYLPVGNRGKDLEKLIDFVAEDDLFSRLEAEGREEIELIVYELLGIQRNATHAPGREIPETV